MYCAIKFWVAVIFYGRSQQDWQIGGLTGQTASDWAIPGRFALIAIVELCASVLDCGGRAGAATPLSGGRGAW